MKIICNIDFKIENKEILKYIKTPLIAVSNHQSFWENFFLQLIIPVHSWVLKKELLDMPLFGRCLKTLDPVAINRNSMKSAEKIINDGQKIIDKGQSIMIFPESGTVPTHKTVKFKTSAARLAIATNSPLVLIAHNSGLAWPKGFWFKNSGVITVRVLEYIEAEKIAQYSHRDLTIYIEGRVNKEKNELVELGLL